MDFQNPAADLLLVIQTEGIYENIAGDSAHRHLALLRVFSLTDLKGNIRRTAGMRDVGDIGQINQLRRHRRVILIGGKERQHNAAAHKFRCPRTELAVKCLLRLMSRRIIPEHRQIHDVACIFELILLNLHDLQNLRTAFHVLIAQHPVGIKSKIRPHNHRIAALTVVIRRKHLSALLYHLLGKKHLAEQFLFNLRCGDLKFLRRFPDAEQILHRTRIISDQIIQDDLVILAFGKSFIGKLNQQRILLEVPVADDPGGEAQNTPHRNAVIAVFPDGLVCFVVEASLNIIFDNAAAVGPVEHIDIDTQEIFLQRLSFIAVIIVVDQILEDRAAVAGTDIFQSERTLVDTDRIVIHHLIF